jgi:hypothetical protein
MTGFVIFAFKGMIAGLVRKNQLSGEAEAVRAQQGRRNINRVVFYFCASSIVKKYCRKDSRIACGELG